MKAVATFTPQAWVRDYAIEVDPAGPTEWVTDFEGLTREQSEAILETGHDTSDLLKEDPAAPEWVRDWPGPFEIHVREYLREEGEHVETKLTRIVMRDGSEHVVKGAPDEVLRDVNLIAVNERTRWVTFHRSEGGSMYVRKEHVALITSVP